MQALSSSPRQTREMADQKETWSVWFINRSFDAIVLGARIGAQGVGLGARGVWWLGEEAVKAQARKLEREKQAAERLADLRERARASRGENDSFDSWHDDYEYDKRDDDYEYDHRDDDHDDDYEYDDNYDDDQGDDPPSHYDD